MPPSTFIFPLRLLQRIGLAACLALSLAGNALAQAAPYPQRPIRIIVPFAAGAFVDSLARTLGERMSVALGQPVIVENKAGASAIIGTDFVAKAKPDGYTLLLASTTNSINPSFFKKLPYDPVKDLTPVTLAATAPFVLVVNPAVPATTFKEFVTLAKNNPRKYAYSSGGNGSSTHLMGAMLADMANLDVLHVPYKGLGPAMADLLAGQVQFLFASYSSAAPHLRGGKLRALAIGGKDRLAALPGVPTIAESGYPEFDATGWWGVYATAGTPKPIIVRLNAELVKILKQPEIGARYRDEAAQMVGSTPEAMATYFTADVARWARVIKAAGIEQE